MCLFYNCIDNQNYMSFPYYHQLDATDCGATSLRIIAAYYGKKFSAKYLREKCYTTRGGVSMLAISDAAEAIGFRARGVKISWEQLRDELNLPCIVHWNQRHFVVVYKIRNRKGKCMVYVSDPASGLLEYTEEAFLKSWVFTDNENSEHIGIALLLETTPKFYDDREENEKDNKINFLFLIKYLKPYHKFIFQLLLAMLIGSLISLIFPFLTQSMVDIGIGNNNLSFVIVILIAQVALTLGSTANSLIRSWLSLHITTRLSISLISDFLFKLMKLPIAFFDTKMVGDIMQRIGDQSRIQSFLTGSLLSIILAIVTFVIYGIIMAGYNLAILGIFVLGSILYILWVILFLRRRRKLDYMRFQAAALNQSNIVQLINGMQDIKLNNCENTKRWEWERIQAKLFNISVKGLALGQTQQVGGVFIDQTKNVLISFIAAQSVINGEMTIGMMMAMQYIIGQLNAPISQFIGFIQATQDAKISLERLNEIHDKEDEEPESNKFITEIPQYASIDFKNVIFQYEGPNSEKVLDGINLSIEPNKITAIVGSSGSGKTTMLKLILGFYQPVDGVITLGNVNLDKYSDRIWRSNCGVVMQDGYIFSDTILNNISLSDEIPDEERVKQAVKIANIEDFIDSLPLGYSTRIGADGHGLSTGQKQRILIARAAYKRANYLIFDEATNSLDANNEKVIMESLNKLFKDKTVIVVAHRLSTVKNADKIIVLDHGRIVEQGTHNELVKFNGYYYKLVCNQLELG